MLLFMLKSSDGQPQNIWYVHSLQLAILNLMSTKNHNQDSMASYSTDKPSLGSLFCLLNLYTIYAGDEEEGKDENNEEDEQDAEDDNMEREDKDKDEDKVDDKVMTMMMKNIISYPE